MVIYCKVKLLPKVFLFYLQAWPTGAPVCFYYLHVTTHDKINNVYDFKTVSKQEKILVSITSAVSGL